MARSDLNLLVVLDVLLREQSVARAAKRLKLSPSAMSRALARLRIATGDPLLVQAGRMLVPSPRALELRDRVARLVEEATEVLRPSARLELTKLTRTFTLRTSEGFVENFGPALITRVRREAPGVQLRFLAKADKESGLLRDGTVDLETGVIDDETWPELRSQSLFEDHLVGAVRVGHPLARGAVTAEGYAACEHVGVSRRSLERGPIDEALRALGLERRIAAVVGGFATAIVVARRSDLLATVPRRHCGVLLDGVHTFELPIVLPRMKVSMLWHPRLDADAAHRWLRECVRSSIDALPVRRER
ncbi:MAG: LysR substrate-binding domain-containing protein [Planctomycetes bacterium]|nr:LysR substrate-binding domain-containing protein [Planctomycetota bacterium]